MTMRRLFRKADEFEKLFWSGENISNLYKRINERADHPMARVFLAGMREWVRTSSDGNEKKITPELINRVDRTLNGAVAQEVGAVSNRLLFLATVGAIAPFVGLFGTVWGIMNSFRALGNVTQATLAHVAPGIAEALIATAMGLFAAIPAVIAYNRYANDVERLHTRYDNFIEEFSAILRRQAHG